MIVNFTFSYGFKPDQETIEKVNNILIGSKLGVDEKDGSIKYWESHTADLNDILEITNEIRLQKSDNLSLEARLINTIERFARGNYSREQQFNEKVNIHVSDIGLLKINEVIVMTNACTEDLQDNLNDGWHIIAVCPQPDQRRPDYVLGRTK